MTIILANFGKHAISYCPFICLLLAKMYKIYILASMLVGHVCYLPKFTFWQVCWLVMFVTCQNLHFGKIYILASMLVGHVCLFVTCQNLILASCYLPKFDFGKYVRSSDKNVGQINRSRSQTVGQILRVS